MTILRVNMHDTGLALHRSPAPVLPTLRRAARGGTGPVIVMVHGFQFRPETPRDCPHDHIFANRDADCWKAKSWPRRLGLLDPAPDAGLGIAFGWNAKGMIWTAYERAEVAGRALAQAITTIRRAAPHRPVHALTHSLGARVVLQALRHLDPGDISRIIALNPAEFFSAARDALTTPAGCETELISVTGRENFGYNLMLERLVTPPHRGDRAMGLSVPQGPGRLTLRLDRADVVQRLNDLGFPLSQRKRRVCHWSPYLRDGALRLYAALMRHADTLSLDALQGRDPARPPVLLRGGSSDPTSPPLVAH